MRRTLLGLLVALMVLPATAGAATYTVDFQSGPPIGQAINDDYVSTAFVRWIHDDPGFRPARRALGATNVAGDIGPSRCVPEGGTGNDCEFVIGGTQFQLTRLATSVKLDAGLFTNGASGPVSVQLQAYRSGATEPFASSAVQTVGFHADSFDQTLTVNSAAADIQKVGVVVTGDGATGADIGIDNIVVQIPDGQVADFNVSMPANTVVLPQGGTV